MQFSKMNATSSYGKRSEGYMHPTRLHIRRCLQPNSKWHLSLCHTGYTLAAGDANLPVEDTTKAFWSDVYDTFCAALLISSPFIRTACRPAVHDQIVILFLPLAKACCRDSRYVPGYLLYGKVARGIHLPNTVPPSKIAREAMYPGQRPTKLEKAVLTRIDLYA